MKATYTCLCKIHSRLYNMYIRPYLKRSILPQDWIQNQWCSYRYILPNVPCLHSWYYSKRCFPSLKSPSFNFRYGTHLKILIEQPHFVSKLWTLPFSSIESPGFWSVYIPSSLSYTVAWVPSSSPILIVRYLFKESNE